MTFGFTLQATDANARAGVLKTAHGDVRTPAFMPVGTQATVKALSPDDLRDIGASMILSNTYHLSLRPGIKAVKQMGGLHQFMGWHGPILTDSGGFQIFSLGHLRRLTDEGVVFRSHIDGSEHALTPELAVEYQVDLGSDIAMVLDHCPAFGETDEAFSEATRRTQLWAERSSIAAGKNGPVMFGIVQGGWSSHLRKRSAEGLASLDFPGYAIGGVSVGEPKALAYQAVDHTVPYLPWDRPRYLMGVGTPEDLLNCISRGIDMFDCTLPARVARKGSLFTLRGRENVRKAQFALSDRPWQEGCDCFTCQTFSAGYMHHLLKSNELLYHRLATMHNLRFVLRLMEDIREAIFGGRFATFAEDFLEDYRLPNEDARLEQKGKWLAARRARGGGLGSSDLK